MDLTQFKELGIAGITVADYYITAAQSVSANVIRYGTVVAGYWDRGGLVKTQLLGAILAA